jgi:hypothetical protein
MEDESAVEDEAVAGREAASEGIPTADEPAITDGIDGIRVAAVA